MRRLIVLLTCATATAASAQSLQLHGFLNARAVRVNTEEAWTEGGGGIFDVGGHRTRNVDLAQLGVDWSPTSWLLVHADGLGRNGAAAGRGKRAGLVQAYADLFNERWRLRAGHFWMPTSRENIDPLWTSHYTITFSALNTWIGEEVRPIGADLQYSPNFYVTAGATAFRGNDTMGTLLADRAWTLGNRLTVYDEVIPGAPDEPTRPMGRDLDSKNGYAERLRVQLPERASLQLTHVDNRAEIKPGRPPNIPWRTKYNIAGATIGSTSPTTLVAEWMAGRTTVGFPGGSFTLGMNTAYALVSHKSGKDRVSARLERFATDAMRGRAMTLAVLHDVSEHTRAGVEYVRATGDKPGTMWTLELRWAF